MIRKQHIVLIYNSTVGLGKDYSRDVTAVSKALSRLGVIVEHLPISKSLPKLISSLNKTSSKCVFNLCEEFHNKSWGEVYVAGLLELMNIPYTGSGPMGLTFGLNKAKSKDILKSHGIKTPKYHVVEFCDSFIAKDITSYLEFPVIVKPLYEDGSYGIDSDSVVNNEKDLTKKIELVFKRFKEPAILEEFIDGRELNVSIVGNGDNLNILPISEILFTGKTNNISKICSYEAKWAKKSRLYKSAVPVCPAELPDSVKKHVMSVCRRVFKIMDCRDYARIDIRLDKNKIPYIIDVNPNPCLGLDGGFVRSAKRAGMSYEQIIGEILRQCFKRYGM